MRAFVKKEVAIVGRRAWNFYLPSNLQEVRSMKKKRLSPQIVFLCFILFFLLPLQSFSQDFPSKPITLYIGYEPGAGTDITGRVLAREAEQLLGVPVVVENKPGGGSSIAAALLAKKKPDGYTLAVVSSSALLGGHIMIPKATFQPFNDFTYLLSYGTYNAGGVCVPTDSPFKTLPEFIEHARKNPGTLSYSTTGTGTNFHLALEYMAKQAGVKFKHVPFKGAGPAMTALLGRHVDFIAGSGSHLIYVRQGIWRMLAVMMGADRDPNFPDVPTFREFGYGCPAAPARLILLAPRDLPEPIYNKLESVFRQAAHSPELRKALEKLDMPVVFMDGRQLKVDLSKDYKFYSEFIQELGLLKK
jgi:tripartite-type tricarboxylate transporter receptor subunit TctC